jgi:protein O-GlcNAc transferase
MQRTDDNQDLQKAYALHQRGSLSDAEALYRKLIQRNAKNFQALHLLGLLEASCGNFDQAKSLMARSLSVRPTNIEFIENYATILFQTADYKAALDIAQNGLLIHSKSVPLTYLCAISLFKLERLSESLAQFDKVLSLQPSNPSALNERGSVLAALKQHDAALASVEKAIALAPNDAEAHLTGGMYAASLSGMPRRSTPTKKRSH